MAYLAGIGWVLIDAWAAWVLFLKCSETCSYPESGLVFGQ